MKRFRVVITRDEEVLVDEVVIATNTTEAMDVLDKHKEKLKGGYTELNVEVLGDVTL